MGDRDHLVAPGLHGAGFVDGDMAGVCGHCRLPGTQEGGNGGEVGLGAAYQEVYCGAGAAEPGPDGGSSGGAVGVFSITGCGLQVSPDQRFQDTGMGAFGVVISKMIHRMLSLSYENGLIIRL